MADSNIANNLKFLQWNINGLRSKSAILKSELHTQNIDIALLQECKFPANLEYNISGYKTFKTPNAFYQRNWCNLMILVKNTLPCISIDNPTQAGEETDVLAVKIFLADTELSCYNLYKHHTGSLDLSELFNQMASETVLLGGDFNAHHPILCSPQRSCDDGHHIAALLDEYPEVALLNNGEPTHIQGGRLDLTFLPTTLRGEAQWNVNSVLTSDHYATSYTIKLARLPPLPPPPSKWKQEMANWDRFQDHLTTWHASYDPPEDEDALENDLVAAMRAAADISMPKIKPGPHRHKDYWYYCPEVKELKRRLNRARRIHKRHPSEGNREQLREVARLVNEQLSEIQLTKWLEWCALLNEHSSLKQIWCWLKKVAGKTSSRPPTHPTPQLKADELAESFARRSDSAQLPPDSLRAQENLNPERWAIINLACTQPAPTDTPYTLHKLTSVKHKGKDTAPGADQITYTMIANLGEAGSLALLYLINFTHLKHTRPLKWNQQDTTPIPKPKDPEASRPIALLSCL
ncbi:MAG: endonuclease/exonuclease/phosphatase family protein [Cyanobacteria bacterium J06614_10]